MKTATTATRTPATRLHALLKLPFADKMQAVRAMSQTHPPPRRRHPRCQYDSATGRSRLLQSITLELPNDAAAGGNSGGRAESITISTVHKVWLPSSTICTELDSALYLAISLFRTRRGLVH
jgi:hypothetical protein